MAALGDWSAPAVAAGVALAVAAAVQALTWARIARAGDRFAVFSYVAYVLSGAALAFLALTWAYPAVAAVTTVLTVAGCAGFAAVVLAPRRVRHVTHLRTRLGGAGARTGEPSFLKRHQHLVHEVMLTFEIAAVLAVLCYGVYVADRSVRTEFDGKADRNVCRWAGC